MQIYVYVVGIWKCIQRGYHEYHLCYDTLTSLGMQTHLVRCFLVTKPRTFPEPLHSSASHGVSTAECFGFSKGAKTSTVWPLWPSVFTVSLNTMSSNEKKPSNIPFCYNFHLLGGAISFCFSPHSSVQPGPRTVCLFRRPGPTPLHSFFFSLHDLYVRMHCLPACLSVPYHISAQGIEHWRTLVLSLYPNYLISFTAFFVSAGEEFGCCAFTCTCRIWSHQTLEDFCWIFYKKKEKKRYLALVTQTIDFIVFM